MFFLLSSCFSSRLVFTFINLEFSVSESNVGDKLFCLLGTFLIGFESIYTWLQPLLVNLTLGFSRDTVDDEDIVLGTV